MITTFKDYIIQERDEFNQYPKLNKKYPRSSGKVDGRRVLKNIDNTSSISSTLDEWEELPGIRVVKMKEFDGPRSVFYAADDFERSRQLADKIKISKEISPLIIVIDGEGPYILEGAHRYVALHNLKAKAFPALVVVDTEEYSE